MHRVRTLAAAVALCACACLSAQTSSTAAVQRQLARVEHAPAGPFKADWDSLGAYRTPEWFRDAKFGIFIHWGGVLCPCVR